MTDPTVASASMPAVATGPSVPPIDRGLSLRRRKKNLRISPPWLAFAWLAVLGTAAIAGPLLTPYDPSVGSLGASLLAPGAEDVEGNSYFLGTDVTGRDLTMLMLYGARIAVLVGLVGVGLAATIGTTIGLIAGVLGGLADSVLMRFVDVVLSIPPILLAILIAATMKPSLFTIFLILGLLLWPNYARLVRGEVLVLRESDYVKLAKVAGCNTFTIMRRHVLPNVLPSVLVLATLQVGAAVILESSLSFLGIGLPPTSASWGGLISQGLSVMSIAWWIPVIPGIAIFFTVFASNAIGDWARIKFDPRLEATS